MTSPLTALRRPRPLSFPGPRTSPSSSMTRDVSLTHVRRASLIPYLIGSNSPPPAPLAPDQACQLREMRFQQCQAQQQSHLEDCQKQRQQRELEQLLANDLVILGQQRSLGRWQTHLETRVEYRQRMDVRKALYLEQQQKRLQILPQLQQAGYWEVSPSLLISMLANEQSTFN
ncbi:hypothetical protein B0O80DRAFT_488183 [Mortierella sp. GBAus27b]|nr:hypothetical protein B0O80DRAFT_488183 [Mortierella sp. GBAus27b]